MGESLSPEGKEQNPDAGGLPSYSEAVNRDAGSSMRDPLVYLGVPIPDPHAPAAKAGTLKVENYRPGPDLGLFLNLNPSSSSCDERVGKLIEALLDLDPFNMDALNDYSVEKTGLTLDELIKDLDMGHYGKVLRALTLGPLGYDVDLVYRAAVSGLVIFDAQALTEVILCRSSQDIRWLKTAFKIRFQCELVDAIKDATNLNGKLGRLYTMALHTQRPEDFPDSLPDKIQVSQDVETLAAAAKQKDATPFIEILVNRSDQHISAVIVAYATRFKSLSKVIKSTFSGLFRDALLFIVHGLKPKRDGRGYWRDAKLIEDAMAGFRPDKHRLVYRIMRAQWNPKRMKEITEAYRLRHNRRPLEAQIRDDTSGLFAAALLEVLQKAEWRAL